MTSHLPFGSLFTIFYTVARSWLACPANQTKQFCQKKKNRSLFWLCAWRDRVTRFSIFFYNKTLPGPCMKTQQGFCKKFLKTPSFRRLRSSDQGPNLKCWAHATFSVRATATCATFEIIAPPTFSCHELFLRPVLSYLAGNSAIWQQWYLRGGSAGG